LPRRYRPPAAKRRKSKRSAPQSPYEQPEPVDGASSPVAASDEDYDEEWEEDEEFDEEPAPRAAVATAVRPAAGRARTQHLQRDFSYVRTELIRVAAVGAFLLIALIITAILR
jgi:hypothetical protein